MASSMVIYSDNSFGEYRHIEIVKFTGAKAHWGPHRACWKSCHVEIGGHRVSDLNIATWCVFEFGLQGSNNGGEN